MARLFKVKKEHEQSILHIQPEVEIIGSVEVEVHYSSNPLATVGYENNEHYSSTKTYCYDKNWILYPEEFLSLYYEEVE